MADPVTQPIHIHLNGEPRELAPGTTVAELVGSLPVSQVGAAFAIERNQDVVPRRTYGEVVLQAGDRVEIVTFVGGG